MVVINDKYMYGVFKHLTSLQNKLKSLKNEMILIGLK